MNDRETAGHRDQLIARRTEKAEATSRGEVVATEEQVRRARMSDIRWVIGGLFVLYGAMLLVASAFTKASQLHKAQGVNINLWTGLGMAVLGLLFLAWARWRPLTGEDVAEATGEGEAGEGAVYPEGEPGAEERERTPL